MIYDYTTYSKRQKFAFATCMVFTRRENDYVEVYLDEIAAAACRANDEVAARLRLKPADLDLVTLIGHLVSTSVVHEWLHFEENAEERSACFATEQLEAALTKENWQGEDLTCEMTKKRIRNYRRLDRRGDHVQFRR
jgi:hypothetical protein